MGLLGFLQRSSEFTEIKDAIAKQASVLVNEGMKSGHLSQLAFREKEGQAAAFAAGQLLDLFFTWFTRANSGNHNAYLRYQDSNLCGSILIDKYLELAARSINLTGKDRTKSGIRFWTCLPFDLMQMNGSISSGSALEALKSKEIPLVSINAICSEVGEDFKSIFWDSLKPLIIDRFAKHSSRSVKQHASMLYKITEDAVLTA